MDLLFLSHLHVDHTNGLNQLLSSFKVREVILPYFPPIERLLIALSNINMPAWYYNFLADPVEFLVEREVDRVIVIGGERKREDNEGRVPPSELRPSSPPEGDFPVEINLEKLQSDEELKEEILKNDKNWQNYIDRQLLAKSHYGYILAAELWLFRLFNYKVPPSALQSFIKCLEKLKIDPRDSKEIKEIIRNRSKLKKLKKCYKVIAKELNKDFNNSSLVVYHGPIGKIYVKGFIFLFYPLVAYATRSATDVVNLYFLVTDLDNF